MLGEVRSAHRAADARSEGGVSKFWVRRMGNQLLALSAEDTTEMMKLPFHTALRIEVKQDRKLGHHRYFWLLCNRIAEALGKTTEEVARDLKYETGHYRIIGEVTMDHPEHGKVRVIRTEPLSISYDAMDQTEFVKFLERCIVAIVETYHMDRAAVIDAVKDILDAVAEGRRAA